MLMLPLFVGAVSAIVVFLPFVDGDASAVDAMVAGDASDCWCCCCCCCLLMILFVDDDDIVNVFAVVVC